MTDAVLTSTLRAAHAVLDEVERAVVGKRDVLELVLMGFLADGHVLLDDLPGVAKTLMARSFAAATGLSFRRISSHPTCCPRTSPARRCSTSAPRRSAFGRVPSSPTSCSPTR